MLLRKLLRASWKSLIIIVLMAFFLYLAGRLINPSNSLGQVLENLGVGAATIAGILSAWGWVDKYLVRRKELIRQVRNQISDEAKSAISQLNVEGYLSNGSLKGVNLRGAKLAGVDLKATNSKDQIVAANLEKVNLRQADLSSADMRGINLEGANLEITNLSNARLLDANLREARFTLTDLRGANLRGADLTGAKFAGETCDHNTILPNGEHWHEKINWSDFEAIEELPEYTRKSIKTPPMSDPLRYENVYQREHDLRLLARLWKKTNSSNIICLDNTVQDRILKHKFYSENFSGYLYERRQYPELRFVSPTLEAQFELYDEALREFDHQLSQSSGVEDFHGTQTIRPDYKQSGIGHDIRVHKEQEWHKTIDKLLELRRVHATLVAFLKKYFPEFDFF